MPVVQGASLDAAEYQNLKQYECSGLLNLPLLRGRSSTAEVGLGVVQRFAADLADAALAGEGFGVALHLAPHKEGDLVQFRLAIGRPQRLCGGRCIGCRRGAARRGTGHGRAGGGLGQGHPAGTRSRALA
jgi:hypothetical protein